MSMLDKIDKINKLLKMTKTAGSDDIGADAIQKIIDDLMGMLKGGISLSELGQLMELLSKFGDSIPSSMMTKLHKALQDLKNSLTPNAKTTLDPEMMKELAEMIMNKLLEKMMDKIPGFAASNQQNS